MLPVSSQVSKTLVEMVKTAATGINFDLEMPLKVWWVGVIERRAGQRAVQGTWATLTAGQADAAVHRQTDKEALHSTMLGRAGQLAEAHCHTISFGWCVPPRPRSQGK